MKCLLICLYLTSIIQIRLNADRVCSGAKTPTPLSRIMGHRKSSMGMKGLAPRVGNEQPSRRATPAPVPVRKKAAP